MMKPLSTIEIQTKNGPKEVQAEILPGGLFALRRHYGRWKWQVAHLPTGLNTGGFGNKSKARKYAKALLALDGIDWTSKNAKHLGTFEDRVRVLYRKFC